MPHHMEPLAECIFFLVAYFLPSIVALLQGKKVYIIFVINLVFGWTIIGWIVAILLAISDRK
jgi:hypothetical protein